MATVPNTRKASVEDVMNLAGLRHFGLSIERRSAELYVTNPGLYANIKALLIGTIRQLKQMEKDEGEKPPGSCYDPYVLCGDRICRLEEDCPS
jgi:hypothetical protein